MIGLVFCESFLRKMFTSYEFAEVFYLKSFLAIWYYMISCNSVVVVHHIQALFCNVCLPLMHIYVFSFCVPISSTVLVATYMYLLLYNDPSWW